MITKNGMTLCRKDGSPVSVGDVLTDFRGDKATVTGGEPPRHSASTGRIYVREEGREYTCEFFPSVFDCCWMEG